MKKTLDQVIQFVAAEMTAASIRGARPVSTGNSTLVMLTVIRSPSLQGKVLVNFRFGDRTPQGLEICPCVDINMPALNDGVDAASAFLALLQDLTSFASTLQEQMDEFEITAE